MNAYLGLAPRCHDSGGKSRPGHTTRESRKLSRTIGTQSIYQTIKATPQWECDYKALKGKRGSGRARIAMIRRLCGVMRRMLLQGDQFHWLKEELYRRKLVEYRKIMGNARKNNMLLDRKHSGRLISDRKRETSRPGHPARRASP